ncbi:hypothetical protein MOBUDSM44075_04211 [Mycolicibacterium obuense]|uniref:Uncharacterized protein n=1 Tax=Mycolicibacterium obuense TaxID=1807 RepID=A0A0J6VMD2_9MYCO|nr:hypothetical protein MOBUDSM44075_04211 [Mycolicibacterium obuense]
MRPTLSPRDVHVFEKNSPGHRVDGEVVHTEREPSLGGAPHRADHPPMHGVEVGSRSDDGVCGESAGGGDARTPIHGAGMWHAQVHVAGQIGPQSQHRVVVEQRLENRVYILDRHVGRHLHNHCLVEAVCPGTGFGQPADDRCRDDGAEIVVGRHSGGGDSGDAGHGGHGLLDEDVLRPEGEPCGSSPRDHLHRRDAVPAEVEERVVDTHPVHTEDLRVDGSQDLLDRGGGVAVLRSEVVRCRQGPGVELVVGRQRDRIDDDDGGGHHVGGQSSGQGSAQRDDIDGGGRTDVSDDPLVAGTVLAGHDGGLSHAWLLGKRVLDLAEFDSVAADLDLLVGTAVVEQLPVGAPADQVTGAIHARAHTAERAGDEPMCRQTAASQIAESDAVAGHVQLTDDPGRNGTQPRVDDEQGGTGHRRPDRNVSTGLQGPADRHAHGGFRRSVGVDHRASRRPLRHHVRRAGLSHDDQCGGVQPVRGEHADRGRCLGEYVDVLVDEHLVQILGGGDDGLGYHDHAATAQQRPQDLPHRDVERQRVAVWPHPGAGQPGVQPGQQTGDVAVADRNTFRGAGGSRGVDEIGDVGGCRRRKLAGCLHAEVGGIHDWEMPVTGQLLQLVRGDHEDGAGIGDHEVPAFGGDGGIDRQVRRTGFEHREDRDDGLPRPARHQRHVPARTCTHVGEPASQAGRCLIEIVIGQRRVPGAHRDGVRCRLDVSSEGDGDRRHVHRSLGEHVAMGQRVQVLSFVRVEELDRCDASRGISADRIEYSLHPSDKGVNAGRVEDIGAIFDGAGDAGGCPGLGPLFSQREHEIHPCRVGFDRDLGHGHIAERQRRGGIVSAGPGGIPGQRDLDDGVVSQVSRRIELLDENFEGDVVVVIGRQAAPTHLRDEIGDGGVSAHVDPQHHQVDETTDEIVEGGVVAACRRVTDRHVPAAARLGQQHRQCRLDHHENRCIAGGGDITQALLQSGRPPDLCGGAALIRHRWIGTVGRQWEVVGQSGQCFPPVPQLRGDLALGVVEVAEPTALPQREVRILNRQR